MDYLEDIVKRFIAGDESEYLIEARSQMFRMAFDNEFKRQLKDLDIKKYYYLITFTLKVDPTLEEEEEIEKYVISQFQRAALKIKEAYYVKEKTKKERTHWHVAVVSYRYIAKNRFNYYAQKYGHVDVSKNHCQTKEEMLNYINKVHESVKIKI